MSEIYGGDGNAYADVENAGSADLIDGGTGNDTPIGMGGMGADLLIGGGRGQRVRRR